jgi:hypothetical protein
MILRYFIEKVFDTIKLNIYILTLFLYIFFLYFNIYIYIYIIFEIWGEFTELNHFTQKYNSHFSYILHFF